jgi:RecB family exonuclease
VSVTVVTTAHGPAAHDALRRVVLRAKGGDVFAPVTVLVPTNAVGVAARRELGREGIANVGFLTAYRLAQLLGGPDLAAAGRRPVSAALLAEALGSVVRAEPGAFAAVAEHAATVDALQRSYRDLRHLPPALAARLAREGSPLARDALRITGATARRLADAWYDEADLVEHAVRRAAAGGRAGAVATGPVVVFLPHRHDRTLVRLLGPLRDAVPVTVIVGLTDDTVADAELAHLAEHVGAPGPLPPVLQREAPEVEVVDTSDADEEVREAVRLVVEHARQGLPLHRIALLWPADEPYRRLVAHHLDAAGLPWHGRAPRQVAERLAGRALLGLCRVDRFGLRREDVFALLATTTLRHDDGRPVAVAAWERVSRAAGVHRGDDWAPRLAAFQQRLRAEAGREDRMPSRLLDHAEELAGFVTGLRTSLGPADATRTWSAWASWGQEWLGHLVGSTWHRRRLPADEQDGADRVEAALDELATLDAVGPPVTRARFADALAGLLERDLGRAGTAGRGVLVGPLADALGQHLGLVVILGGNDGRLPGPPASDAILGEADRALTEGLLPSAEQHAAAQRRHFLTALQTGTRAVVLRPRGDLRRSTVHLPSRWLDELVPGHRHRARAVDSFVAGVGAAAFPPTPQQHRLRTLLAAVRAGRPLDHHPLVAADTALARGLRLLRARASHAFTPFDGDLRGVPVPSPIDDLRAVSPTALETWASCPHRYFVERLLGVQPVENPEDVLVITARDRGNLVHATVDRFHQTVLRGELPMPGAGRPWGADHRAALLAIFDEQAADAERRGLTGRPSLWFRERVRLRADLQAWLDDDSARRQVRGTELLASEQRFGFDDGGWPAAAVTLGDGRAVRFRGVIDRVDASPARVVVTDHKTGSDSRFADLEATRPHGRGTKLQLLVYAAAARTAMDLGPDHAVEAEYSFISRRARYLRRGYDVGPDQIEQFRRALDVIVLGVETGLFPSHPQAPGYRTFNECPACDPDDLGTSTRFREWTRKRLDPALAAYLRLTEELAEELADEPDPGTTDTTGTVVA